jgi:L,D-transpeptidase YbiS
MQTPATTIRISVPEQRLHILQGESLLASYPVSTSRFGVGSEEGSHKTPVGRFRIGEKIGGEHPPGTVFRGRVPVAPEVVAEPGDDLILSRILWLDGVEAHNANTRGRYIYIHGTNHEEEIGQPTSHGCIRMRKDDLLALFDLVPLGSEVVIAA